jgi:hypothetical protein
LTGDAYLKELLAETVINYRFLLALWLLARGVAGKSGVERILAREPKYPAISLGIVIFCNDGLLGISRIQTGLKLTFLNHYAAQDE